MAVDVDDLVAALEARRRPGAPKLGYRIKFDLKEDGVIMLDGTEQPAEITTEDGESDTTLIMSADTFKQILDGTINPMFAYMSGKLKIKGSQGVAMKLASFLDE
ncbi:MAG: SCP2 sterol-binding domain-containing protein [Pseudomonadota bacterium]